MNRMKGLNLTKSFSENQDLEVSRPASGQRHNLAASLAKSKTTSLLTVGQASRHEMHDTRAKSIKLHQHKNQIVQRANLYNWNFSVTDLLEILLVLVFNQNVRRQ